MVLSSYMERREVEPGKLAGVIKAHRYDEHAKSLRIEFQDGRVWVHSGISKELYDQFCKSNQPSAFWAVAIRQAVRADGTKKIYPVVQVA